jgi:RimJ/RimL family protein N-acetyltransferase
MPTIDTARLRLRPFSPDDAPAYHAAVLSDADVMRYLPTGEPLPAAHTGPVLDRIRDHWEQYSYGLWAVIHRADDRLIGHCGLHMLPEGTDVEVAYALAKAYWGQGLAAEAARASLRYGFETLGLERIIAVAMPANTPSLRVMEKIGMAYQGVIPAYGTELPGYALARAAFQPGDAPYTLRDDA